MLEWTLIMSFYAKNMPGDIEDIKQTIIPGFTSEETCQTAMKQISLELVIQEAKTRKSSNQDTGKNNNEINYTCLKIEK